MELESGAGGAGFTPGSSKTCRDRKRARGCWVPQLRFFFTDGALVSELRLLLLLGLRLGLKQRLGWVRAVCVPPT